MTDPEIAKDATKFLFFADYMIWSHAWAICCQPGKNSGRIAVIASPDRFVADSFADFVDIYVQACGSLL